MTASDNPTPAEEVGTILITARPFDEYRAMFALGEADLGYRILEARAGRRASPPRCGTGRAT